MKQFSLSIFLLLLPMMADATAYDFVVDGIYYHYDSKNRTASIASRSTSDALFSDMQKYEGDIVIPSEVTYNGRTIPITKVEGSAFSYCTELHSVILPNSVTSIGGGAFSMCTSLETVVLPEGLTMIEQDLFNKCRSLVNVEIPSSVISFGDHAFEGCSSLKKIVMPEGLTDMGDGTFNDCTNLEEVIFSDNLIRVHGFKNCTSLKNVRLPHGKLQFVDYQCFENCTSFTVITLPVIEGTSTKVTKGAYKGCTNVHKLVIEDGNGTIELPEFKYNQDHPFSGCSIDTIYYGANVRMEKNNLFYNLGNLKVLYLGEHTGKMYRFGENIEKIYSMIKDPSQRVPIFPDKVYVNATLYVPTGTKEKYMVAEGWEEFFNIVEIDYDSNASGNGTKNASDIVKMVNYIMGKAYNEFDEKAADINGDGVVNIADIVKLVNIILGNL